MIYYRYIKLLLDLLLFRLKRKKPVFSVVVGKISNCQFLEQSHLKNPPNGYYADPFVFDYAGKTYVILEKYSFHQSKGVICLGEIIDGEITNLNVVLEERFHLSFPYVFTYEDNLYLIPESAAAKEVRLYKALSGPSEWQFCRTILSGERFVDTVCFEADNQLYLLTTFDSSGKRRSQSELHMYQSKVLEGPWIPSKKNPIIVDNRYGRNAGLIRSNAKIFRCSQSFENFTYGISLQVHEILAIEANNYTETKPIFTLMNAHHLSVLDDIYVSDLRL